MEKHIFLFGEIGGWGINEADILKEIAQAKEDKAEQLIVQISSFGGYVYSGRAIYNALKTSGIPVRVEIIGQAFSIASYIAMAGDEILIAEKAEMMIHPAWSFAEGNAEEMRKQADELEKMSEEIFSVYVARGADEDTIRTYFDEERILTAQEAIDAGLATGILEPMKAVAKFNKGIKSPNKSEEMDKSKFDQLIEAVNSLVKKIKGGAKNASVTADDGTVLYFDGDVIAVDTAVFADEAMTEPAADGSYVEGNTTYTVAGGVVTEIAEAEAESEEMAALKAELETKTAELDAMKAEIAELKAANEAEKVELNKELDSIKNVLIQEKVNIDRKVEKDDKPKFESIADRMKKLAAVARKAEQN